MQNEKDKTMFKEHLHIHILGSIKILSYASFPLQKVLNETDEKQSSGDSGGGGNLFIIRQNTLYLGRESRTNNEARKTTRWRPISHDNE